MYVASSRELSISICARDKWKTFENEFYPRLSDKGNAFSFYSIVCKFFIYVTFLKKKKKEKNVAIIFMKNLFLCDRVDFSHRVNIQNKI